MITTQNRIYPKSELPPSADDAPSLNEKLQQGALKARDATGHFIADHPIIMIGSALTAGVFVGWLIKRR